MSKKTTITRDKQFVLRFLMRVRFEAFGKGGSGFKGRYTMEKLDNLARAERHLILDARDAICILEEIMPPFPLLLLYGRFSTPNGIPGVDDFIRKIETGVAQQVFDYIRRVQMHIEDSLMLALGRIYRSKPTPPDQRSVPGCRLTLSNFGSPPKKGFNVHAWLEESVKELAELAQADDLRMR